VEDFIVRGSISSVETIAHGSSIRDLARLVRKYGPGRWRKCKGTATVELESGALRRVELHWYEAHDLGRKELKIKSYLE
jgi:hypothetical protein